MVLQRALTFRFVAGVLPPGRRELDDFVEKIESLSIAKRRANLLATARSILINEDINMVEVSHATERGEFDKRCDLSVL